MNEQLMNNNNGSEDAFEKLISSLLGKTKEKLTNWKNEPKASDLMEDFTKASTYHAAQMTRISEWLKQLHPETDKKRLKNGRSGIAPKVIRRFVEWRYASLASSILNERNLFTVMAQQPQYINASIQNSMVLNFQFNHLINKVKFVNDLVRTLVNEGTAIARIGWDSEIQTKEKEIPVYQYIEADINHTNMLMQTLQMLEEEMQATGAEYAEDTQIFQHMPPDMAESLKQSQKFGRPVVAIDTGKTQIIKEQVETRNRPEIKIINNADLVIDPTCDGDFSKAKFAIYRYKTSLSELKAVNQKAPNTYMNLSKFEDSTLKGVSADNAGLVDDLLKLPNDVFTDLVTDVTTGSSRISGFEFKDKPRQQMTAYEYWGYWDIDGTGVVQGIVATIVNNVIIRLQRNPFPDNKLPFVVIQYMPTKNSVYGEPDAELIGDNQQIIQALTRSVIDLNARSANGQTATPKGFLDPINAMKFRTGQDYEYNPIGMHPAEAVYTHTASETPQSVLALIQSQYAEAESAVGVKAFQNGIDGNAYGQVVAGMSQALTAMTQREGDIIFRIAKGLEEIGNKIVAMNQEWLSEEEVVAISGGEFIKISRDALAGDFFLAVTIKSNSESEGKAQQLTFMAQTLGENVDWGIRKLMYTEIARLYNLDNMVVALRDYEPQPDPFQQQMQQLQLEEQQLKNEKLRAEAEYYTKRSEFIDAQVDDTAAQTDQRALDFLEQQEGVKHARQREIVEAQARAQNEGKTLTEDMKRRTTLDKAAMDNQAKLDVARENARNRGDKSTGQPSPKKRSLPNPEVGSFPAGLHRADGIGNYIRGDGQTVNNQI